MAGKYEAPRRRRRFPRFLPILLLLAAGGLAALLLPRPDLPQRPQSSQPTESSGVTVTFPYGPSEEVSVPAETTLPVPEVTASATIGAQGDLLMHIQLIQSSRLEDGSYDFSPMFRHMAPYVRQFDHMAVNLETTLGGSAYPYRGNPEFNCPDQLADALAQAGYDTVLTANNHSSDTRSAGIFRTLEQLRSRNLRTLGTMLNNGEDKYAVVDINGIKVGMFCYTYATNELSEGQPSLNYRDFIKEKGTVNYYLESKLERFFEEAEAHVAAMRADGAEAIVLFIHWGQEYVTTENTVQQGMAQRLCDLGVDVIIGSHPHVVQPVELVESTMDPGHRTVCIYSLGNTVSNQMKNEDKAFASGHTEDGALFTVTFEKYDDGTVKISTVDVLPTWVNRHDNTGTRQYDILPLDKETEDQWQTLYGLTDDQFASAQESWERTMEIVGDGLAKCQEYLSQ